MIDRNNYKNMTYKYIYRNLGSEKYIADPLKIVGSKKLLVRTVDIANILYFFKSLHSGSTKVREREDEP